VGGCPSLGAKTTDIRSFCYPVALMRPLDGVWGGVGLPAHHNACPERSEPPRSVLWGVLQQPQLFDATRPGQQRLPPVVPRRRTSSRSRVATGLFLGVGDLDASLAVACRHRARLPTATAKGAEATSSRAQGPRGGDRPEWSPSCGTGQRVVRPVAPSTPLTVTVRCSASLPKQDGFGTDAVAGCASTLVAAARILMPSKIRTWSVTPRVIEGHGHAWTAREKPAPFDRQG